jgi:anti-anti-sigma regulatory factor
VSLPSLTVGVAAESNTGPSVIFAGDYLNKLMGEQLEYECRRRLETGCKELVVDFSKTELVNSVGISILLGVIDIAATSGAKVVFSEMNENTVELFEMLGLTRHVTIA